MNEPEPDNPEKPPTGRRRAWLLLPVLLSLAVAYLWLHQVPNQAPKTWRAETRLEILHHVPIDSSSPLDGVPPQEDPSLETQIALIQSGEMAQRTLIQLKNDALMKGLSPDSVSFTPDQIERAVRVTNPTGTNILVVTTDANDREQAGLLAEAVARAFVAWKQEDAQQHVMQAERNLNQEADRAGRAMDAAERQEREIKMANPHSDLHTKENALPDPAGSSGRPAVGLPQDYSANRLRQNTEIATELYKRVQMAYAMNRLQRGSIAGNVVIIQHAVVTDTSHP